MMATNEISTDSVPKPDRIMQEEEKKMYLNKVLDIFEGSELTPINIGSVCDAVMEHVIAGKKTKEQLEKLFNSQIQTLKKRGAPEIIIGWLNEDRYKLIEKAEKMTFQNGIIPFIRV